MSAAAPIGAQDLHARALQVIKVTHAVFPSTAEVASAIGDLADQADPTMALAERRALTSLAARVNVISASLLGFLGEHNLALPDHDDLAAGLAERGVFLPPRQKRPRQRGGSR